MNDYIKTKKINIDLEELIISCYKIRDIVTDNFVPHNDVSLFNGQDQVLSRFFAYYNALMYPYPQIWNLYEDIRLFFRDVHGNNTEPHFLQCWLNFYNQGDFIDWHGHWTPEFKTYHGFFCVDTYPSKTTYRIPGAQQDIDVISEDNLLVLSRSDGDIHKTWPWEQQRPRITIAFDIVPLETIRSESIGINHWLPI